MFDVWRYAIRFLVGNENVVQTLVDDKNRGNSDYGRCRG